MNSYIAIDLKSFYASVECIERDLDPLTTNLVVADESRSTKTICLAATPSLKSYGIPGRARLFEVVQKTKEANLRRKTNAPKHVLTGESCDANELAANPTLAVSYIVAKPRMALYMNYSTRIYSIYLKYIAAEDIHIYSIDEVFMDVTPYLKTYGLTAHELALKLIREVLAETGITATAGIGTNLYLAKIAMDIVAKKMPADKDGVRIAELDEMSYREKLWSHTPLTDFWRVGKGYVKKLEAHGLHTMGDIARCSLGKRGEYHSEALLYKLFGVNAELLIDHAWGWEPCTMEAVKSYKPTSNSLGSGQVLQEPYSHDKGRLIVWEMTDLLVLDLVAKGLVTDQMVLHIGYDIENMQKGYQGGVHVDHYGRSVPKPAHGSINLEKPTSSAKKIVAAALNLFDRIANPMLLVRRVNIVASHATAEALEREKPQPFDLFADMDAQAEAMEQESRERAVQRAIIEIRQRFGKNAILKASNLEEDAMTKERNGQIGGHRR